MSILSLSAKAQKFYESTRTKTLYSGYDKNVLVRNDHDNCLFVDSNYLPVPGDTIFRLRTVNQQTVIDLKTHVPDEKPLEEIALKGKFSQNEWATMLKAMNGIITTPEIDPRQEIAGEVDNPVLEEKIMALTLTDAHILLREIKNFWNQNKPTQEIFDRFV